MNNFDAELLPPSRLAIAYATQPVRDRFALLLQFDTRFADIVGKATEPLIGQMKLAWWRDVIGMTSHRRPSGEPLVGELIQLDDADLEHALLELLTAWEGILVAEYWDAAVLETFVSQRCTAIFSTYAKWIGADSDLTELGSRWAFNDLKARFGPRVEGVQLKSASGVPTERRLRPLTILALSVSDVSGPRLLWHALTGR